MNILLFVALFLVLAFTFTSAVFYWLEVYDRGKRRQKAVADRIRGL